MRPVRFSVASRNEWPVCLAVAAGAARERRGGRKVSRAAGNFPSTFSSSAAPALIARAGTVPTFLRR